ncbi:hypothetical protein T06_10581 [Trichinella sp. T6]|nr:hypothetical protein T06_10581 [Trichinella sp. T6]
MKLILSEQFAGKSLLMINNAYRVYLIKLNCTEICRLLSHLSSHVVNSS